MTSLNIINIRNIFRLKGRISRRHFWFCILSTLLIYLSALVVWFFPIQWAFEYAKLHNHSSIVLALGALIIYLLPLLLILALFVRRFHDVGISALVAAFIIFIPFLARFLISLFAVIFPNHALWLFWPGEVKLTIVQVARLQSCPPNLARTNTAQILMGKPHDSKRRVGFNPRVANI